MFKFILANITNVVLFFAILQTKKINAPVEVFMLLQLVNGWCCAYIMTGKKFSFSWNLAFLFPIIAPCILGLLSGVTSVVTASGKEDKKILNNGGRKFRFTVEDPNRKRSTKYAVGYDKDHAQNRISNYYTIIN